MRRTQIVLAFFVAMAMLVAVTVAGSLPAQAQDAPAASGLVVVESTQTFEETWTSLTDALAANPNIRVISQVDHAAAAALSDLSLEPNRVIFFGNPSLGTPLMSAGRSAGIDLPQKMQVFEQGGRVWVAFNSTEYLSSRHGVGAAPTLGTIGGALSNLASIATNTIDAVPAGGTVGAGAGLTTTASPNDFETTWSQLNTAIEASPANVAFIVDHGANSGGALAPTRLVVFGNPAIGTPMMAEAATAGNDLPLKILVYEDDDGVTQVVSSDPSFLQQRHGFAASDAVGAASNAIANFTAAATAPADPPPTDAADTDEDEGAGASDEDETTEDEVLGVTELATTGANPQLAMLATALIATGCTLVAGTRRRRNLLR